MRIMPLAQSISPNNVQRKEKSLIRGNSQGDSVSFGAYLPEAGAIFEKHGIKSDNIVDFLKGFAKDLYVGHVDCFAVLETPAKKGAKLSEIFLVDNRQKHMFVSLKEQTECNGFIRRSIVLETPKGADSIELKFNQYPEIQTFLMTQKIVKNKNEIVVKQEANINLLNSINSVKEENLVKVAQTA